MRIRNEKDFWSGVMFVTIGVATIVIARDYGMGTLRSMGPGWFPTAIGTIMALLGAVIALRSLGRSGGTERIERIGLRELLLLALSIALFAFLLPRLGMVISVAILSLVAIFADHGFRMIEAVIITVSLVLLSWLIFALGLSVQMPVWPTVF
ncbi:hypothetical protein ATO6_13255 [Oceanicola sp. 22II-s10i]|uniref:tripartite tricarboxylate transporter TctB family protein n=1 Tax=Oceanicola sp. 22II-s10i TaxID=1317116 RepID=UPI000B5291B5|nr:tripartite tricarboxylate transporter TctB family protein [Oceanicola sp. 22II-s10i]OWU84620.1 hypothetical protein ATO6_13255 [Oceanicola sp. 22II-s10i]